MKLHELSVEPSEELDGLARELVRAFGDVRAELGAGLVESVYVDCLVEELGRRGIRCEREVEFPIVYRGLTLGRRIRVDLLVEGRILVEAKAVEALHPAHYAQFLTYLRMSRRPLGFLVNFNAVPFGEGIHRRINASALSP